MMSYLKIKFNWTLRNRYSTSTIDTRPSSTTRCLQTLKDKDLSKYTAYTSKERSRKQRSYVPVAALSNTEKEKRRAQWKAKKNKQRGSKKWACKVDHTPEEKQMQQNKPPEKRFKDLSSEEKKQYIKTKVAECRKRKSRQMVQAERKRYMERKRAFIMPTESAKYQDKEADLIDHVAVGEDVGTQSQCFECFCYIRILKFLDVKFDSCWLWFADPLQANVEGCHQQVMITSDICSWKASCPGNVHSCMIAPFHQDVVDLIVMFSIWAVPGPSSKCHSTPPSTIRATYFRKHLSIRKAIPSTPTSYARVVESLVDNATPHKKQVLLAKGIICGFNFVQIMTKLKEDVTKL